MTYKVKIFVLLHFWLSLASVKTSNNDSDVEFSNLNDGNNSVVDSSYPKIPFVRCCENEIFYNQVLDKCDNTAQRPANGTQPDAEIVPFTKVSSYKEKEKYLNFYNFNDSAKMEHRNILGKSQHTLLFLYANATGLADCPKGYTSVSTERFGLFENGFAKASERYFKMDEYCLNKVTKGSTGINYVIRFCIPDPCISGTGCIRKCCRSGFALEDDKCMPHSVYFNTSLMQREDGELIDSGSFHIHYQAIPDCTNVGYVKLESKNFSILSDGRMNHGEITTDEYCVDNQYDNKFNETKLIGVKCIIESGEWKYINNIKYISLFFSTFVIATFVVYAILPKMRNIHGVIVMCYLASLAVYNILRTLKSVLVSSYIAGRTTVSIEYFCLLRLSSDFTEFATFSWLNVLFFDVWRTFKHFRLTISTKSPDQQYALGLLFLYYSTYGWGIPCIIVVIQQLVHLPKYKAGITFLQMCLHYGDKQLIIVPQFVMLLINLFMFVWISIVFCTNSVKLSQGTGVSRTKQRVQVIFFLFLLTGVSSATETIRILAKASYFNVFVDTCITLILNMITSCFVFVSFVCKPKVLKMLKLEYPFLSRAISAWERIAPCRVFRNGENVPMTNITMTTTLTCSQVNETTPISFPTSNSKTD